MLHLLRSVLAPSTIWLRRAAWIGAGIGALTVPAFAQSWRPLDSAGPVEAGVPLLLTDGTVMVHEISTPDWYLLTPDAFGNYQHGTWSSLPSMSPAYGPIYFASAVLADGRVVVMGGEYNFGTPVWTNQGAIFDPVTRTWATMNAPIGWSNIGDAQCTVMPDGRLFLANPFDTRTAMLNPTTLHWTQVGTGKTDRNDEEGWTLLPDGTILTVDAILAPATERYLPTLDTWIGAGNTPQSLTDAGSQEMGPAVLRPDGTVFAMGATGHNAVYIPPALLTGTGTWLAAPDFPFLFGQQLDIADGPACLLPSGNVLCAASPGVFNAPTRFFEFDGASLIPEPQTPNADSNPSFVNTMLILPTGEVLMTDFSSDVELYTPAGAPDNAWRPTITSFPGQIAPGASYAITGTQFNGLSQATGYGDDSTNATNYPLVRLTNTLSGHVFYARTFGHSTMAVATGALPTSTHFQAPANLESGTYTLEVVTNGIASLPVSVKTIHNARPGPTPGRQVERGV